MKKLLILVLLVNVIWSCNNHKSLENKNSATLLEADENQTRTTTEKLELNNGVKWKVDSTTNKNVNNLKLILEKFDNGSDKSFSAYKKTQGDLQNGVDTMIIECKMKGPDHQALHKWLEPMIMQVTKLKQANTVHDAAEDLKVIQEQVNHFSQYFTL